MAALGPAKDAELMLHTDKLGPRKIDILCSHPVILQAFLVDLEYHLFRVIIPLYPVVHGDHPERIIANLSADGNTQIVGEGCNATISRRIIAQKETLQIRARQPRLRYGRLHISNLL